MCKDIVRERPLSIVDVFACPAAHRCCAMQKGCDRLVPRALKYRVMPKRNKRVPRPKDELKQELVEQLQLLQLACRNYDSGIEASGKDIALRLRVLLNHFDRSQALLEQLGMRTGKKFVDSAGPLHPNNILSECNLIAHRLDDNCGRYVPSLHAGAPPANMHPIPFTEWWTQPVLKDGKKREFSRWQLVSNVANTDGGGHVDPELEEAYMELSRKNSLGWTFVSGRTLREAIERNPGTTFEGRPELACMRQIAHELLCTIHSAYPEYASFSEPVMP